jgi:LEA14-like dessication related protein
MTATVKLDGKWELGPITIAKPVVLPPTTPTMVEVPLTLPCSDLSALVSIAAQTRAIPYVVQGTVRVGGERLNVDVPFGVTGEITPAQLAAAAAKSLPPIPNAPR